MNINYNHAGFFASKNWLTGHVKLSYTATEPCYCGYIDNDGPKYITTQVITAKIGANTFARMAPELNGFLLKKNLFNAAISVLLISSVACMAAAFSGAGLILGVTAIAMLALGLGGLALEELGYIRDSYTPTWVVRKQEMTSLVQENRELCQELAQLNPSFKPYFPHILS